ncbi:Ig-like domain-containing protein [Microbulbifer bruguierae]|uniref:Ig-like domain-containing protein n=1 Tax=Microbulbifer bruguierae TaxID=3029061 RepID=A0ABY8NH35_9GAMM|nr:Ig-like domain-containing protein [Microbulbifer bruguierae]WGL17719.1 Ig-like domain-containing protein [Microbulbifer bruguierae]
MIGLNVGARYFFLVSQRKSTERRPSPLQGDAVHLVVGQAIFNPAGGSGTGAILYSSSNTSVATVDERGAITAVAPDSTIITANQAADGTYAADSAEFEERLNFAMAAFADKLWITSGYVPDEVGYYNHETNDVWYSEDGRHWPRTATAGLGGIFPPPMSRTSTLN